MLLTHGNALAGITRCSREISPSTNRPRPSGWPRVPVVGRPRPFRAAAKAKIWPTRRSRPPAPARRRRRDRPRPTMSRPALRCTDSGLVSMGRGPVHRSADGRRVRSICPARKPYTRAIGEALGALPFIAAEIMQNQGHVGMDHEDDSRLRQEPQATLRGVPQPPRHMGTVTEHVRGPGGGP